MRHREGVIQILRNQLSVSGQQHVVIAADLHAPEQHMILQSLRLRGHPVMVANGHEIIIPVSQRQLFDSVPAADAEGGVNVQATAVPCSVLQIRICDFHTLAPV